MSSLAARAGEARPVWHRRGARIPGHTGEGVSRLPGDAHPGGAVAVSNDLRPRFPTLRLAHQLDTTNHNRYTGRCLPALMRRTLGRFPDRPRWETADGRPPKTAP